MTDWTDLTKNTASWTGLTKNTTTSKFYSGFLRKEDEGFLLQENGDKIKLESNADASITWGFQDKS